jgi:DNA-binding response OmpR family regulator
MEMRKKILVLDDDADLLNIIDYLLTDNGYDTLTLAKGDLLTENIEQFRPDLVLMDIMLAGMDGRELCKVIKANVLYNMPVVLISGTHELEQVMSQPGAPNDFIAKPFDIDDLLRKVEYQLS